MENIQDVKHPQNNNDDLIKKGKKILRREIILLITPSVLLISYLLLSSLIKDEGARFFNFIFVFMFVVIPLIGIISLIFSILLLITAIKGIQVSKELKKENKPYKFLLVTSWVMILVIIVIIPIRNIYIKYQNDKHTIPSEYISGMSVDDFKKFCIEKGTDGFTSYPSQVAIDNGAPLGSCYDRDEVKTYWLKK